MAIECSFDGKLVVWKYDRLHVLGMLGELKKQLDELEKLYPDKSQTFEFAPVKRELKRDFLAAFYLDPPIDFTMVRALSGESSIVTYSLDKDKSRELIDDIVSKSGFFPRRPEQYFINLIESELSIEIANYELCLQGAKMLNIDMEKIFGAVRYANFLNSYKKISSSESMKIAAEKFGLSKIFDSF